MSRYLAFWNFILRPFGREAWRNPNYLFCVQIVRRPTPSSQDIEQ